MGITNDWPATVTPPVRRHTADLSHHACPAVAGDHGRNAGDRNNISSVTMTAMMPISISSIATIVTIAVGIKDKSDNGNGSINMIAVVVEIVQSASSNNVVAQMRVQLAYGDAQTSQRVLCRTATEELKNQRIDGA